MKAERQQECERFMGSALKAKPGIAATPDSFLGDLICFVREREIKALQNANRFLAEHPRSDGYHTYIDPEALVDWEPKPISEREKVCGEILKRLSHEFDEPQFSVIRAIVWSVREGK